MVAGTEDPFTGAVNVGDRIWSSEAICSLSHIGRPSIGQNEGNTEGSRAEAKREGDREQKRKGAH